ncbi:MAG: 4a-hydroxytetrahydrobiopterin dehydratase [Propionicimonas sp.]|uniref:4a-hydroxytetrahydrobiopterin dehydratase n=1 Tax=Propionicimonas sp. TaxID=1955623 RepID=UPI002B217569|nr:4a-hydroxytetrahydrobiopterin dehydratase [Propionicimonas sp.]MEA4943384.1 4a-hydroxytetrahydrobiopterin dehydratase [Propionicimonas sp.]MEA5053438.1 4a-hydroxytetrahydrobiopterin dehydratase [Propionicimonas sp.]
MSDVRLTPEQVAAAGLDGWQQSDDTLRARFATGDFATGLEFVNRVGAAAEARQHHPDLTLTYPEVTISLSSHDVGGLTSRDIELAREISAIAAALHLDHSAIADGDGALGG